MGIAKTGGNKKGSVQHKNVAIDNKLRLFINKNFDSMTRTWEGIEDPVDKVKTFLDIMNYVFPKMRSIEFKAEEGTTTLEAKMLLMMQKTTKNEVEDTDAEEVG